MFIVFLLLRDQPHALDSPGVLDDSGFSGVKKEFQITDSSLSAQFLFATDKPSAIQVDSIPLTQAHFLLNSPDSITLTFSRTVFFTVWVFPRSLCDDQVSVFAANDTSRFRLHYHKSLQKRCFFSLNREHRAEFILFSRPVPSGSPLVFAVNSESVLNGTYWMSSTSELPRTKTDGPVFYGFSDAVEDSEWALNINFTTIEPDMITSCFFESTVVYENGTFESTSPADLGHFYQCGLDDSLKTWMFFMFGVWLVISVIIIFVVGYCCFRSWKEPVVPSMSTVSGETPSYNSMSSIQLVSASDILGNETGYTEGEPF